VSVGWRHGIISANIGYKAKLVAIRDAKRPEGTPMKLEGIHHVTAITADAPRNVDFYTRVLGLRMVKKTVNQDDPTVYHLFYADEKGSPGSDVTFFEYPGLPRGRAGAGMVHTVAWRVGSPEAFGFWADRLGAEGIETQRDGDGLRFSDPEGMGLALRAVETDDEPLVAVHPEIPADVALQGFDGVRAYASEPEASRPFLEEALSFEPQDGATWEVRGDDRGSHYGYDAPPDGRGLSGAGTVHHVAWASPTDEHEAWRDRVAQAGARPTPVIDRFYFRSIYFREPSGVLFEIATLGPGFTADESQETLGEALSLPPAYEPLRERLEHVLTPLPDPRPARTAK
jgi:glyoxalase family protein